MWEVYKALCNTKLILHITLWTIIDNYKIEFTYKKKDEWILKIHSSFFIILRGH